MSHSRSSTQQKPPYVLIYCRESRDDGYANYERIETQRDILIAYCEKRKLGSIIDIVMDDNVSGTDFSRLEPIKERIRRKEIDFFVCKDASRIGRHLLDSLAFIAFLEQHHVTLVFESEPYNEDIFPLIAWFNERRVKEDSQKIRRVLRHKMITGELVIKAPFGYDKQGNTLVINEEAARVVREIFALYTGGMSGYAIAARMNEQGYPTPSQLKARHTQARHTPRWNKQHIERIVTHMIYTGDMPYGRREKASYKSNRYITKDKGDWIIIPHHHPPIVSREVFDAAQQRRKIHKAYEPASRGRRPFSGLVYCGRCGSKLYAKTKKGRATVLICSKHNAEGCIKAPPSEGYGCTPHRVRESELSDIVLRYLSSCIRHPAFRPAVLQALTPGNKACTGRGIAAAIKKETSRLEQQRDTLQNRASRVYDDKLSGVLPGFLFEQKINEITTEINQITDALKQLAHDRHELEKNGCDGSGISADDFVDGFLETIRQNGFASDALALLFKKIIFFAPKEISANYREQYPLTTEEYDGLWQNGGLLFVQHASF